MEPPLPNAAAGGAGAPAVGAPAPPVYTFLGHSKSTGEILYVPDGCMLVTLVKCGDKSYFQYGAPINIFTALFQNEENIALLSNPVANKERIERLIGPGIEIGINYPGAPMEKNRKYADVEYTAVLDHIYDVGNIAMPPDPVIQRSYALYPSGLYTVGETNLRPILEPDTIDRNIDRKSEIINWMYGESKYPGYIAARVEFVRKENATFQEIINTIGQKYKIKQSELFRINPGIYYLVTCRVIPEEIPKEKKINMDLRRRGSRGDNIINYNHDPKEANFRGNVGQRFRLPLGINASQYLYHPNTQPVILERNATGRQIIRIERRPRPEAAAVGGAGAGMKLNNPNGTYNSNGGGRRRTRKRNTRRKK